MATKETFWHTEDWTEITLISKRLPRLFKGSGIPGPFVLACTYENGIYFEVVEDWMKSGR